MVKISVITINLNNKEAIRQTIESVVNQKFCNIEYIVIDGGSTDGSVEVIKEYQDKINYWISEPDKDIYDAMNKGIDLAKGEWIVFINSGDWFYNNDVLNNINNLISKDVDVIYGDTHLRYSEKYKGFTRIQKAGELSKLYRGMVFSHQSVFVKTELMKQFKFKSNLYNYTADFDFFLQLFISNKNFFNSNMIISSILAGGKSDNKFNRINSLLENFKISKSYLGYNYIIRSVIFMIKEMTIAIFQSLTPKGIQPFFINLLKRG